MSQVLRFLPGRYAIALEPSVPAGGFLWAVSAPDGVTVVRESSAGEWRALWSGDTAHAPDTPGMLVALLAPLAAAGIPVMACSTLDADVVLVPAGRAADALAALLAAGHRTEGAGPA